MLNAKEISDLFIANYGQKNCIITSAPGRVNIIGEHTDYNSGFVLPMPIENRVWIAASARKDGIFRIKSVDYNEDCSFSVTDLKFNKKHRWVNYVMGIISALKAKGYIINGVDMLIRGDVPQGAGLSSSAALEVAVAKVFNSIYDLRLSPFDIAYLGKMAENNFIGVKSGIMDQFSASIGELGKALLIDCRNNESRSLDLPPGSAFVAVHTGIYRKLDSSIYNERVNQCKKGIDIINQTNTAITSLRDLTPRLLKQYRGKMPDIIFRRCQHVVTENIRVLEAVEAIKSCDIKLLGKLMYDSHRSLRDDYNVSCEELDILVEISRKTSYVFGARLTGAGFGGCTINLLPIDRTNSFKEIVMTEYKKETSLDAQFYPVYVSR
jgi:galactokinase